MTMTMTMMMMMMMMMLLFKYETYIYIYIHDKSRTSITDFFTQFLGGFEIKPAASAAQVYRQVPHGELLNRGEFREKFGAQLSLPRQRLGAVQKMPFLRDANTGSWVASTTPWKINMEPENDGLENDVPFQLGDF